VPSISVTDRGEIKDEDKRVLMTAKSRISVETKKKRRALDVRREKLLQKERGQVAEHIEKQEAKDKVLTSPREKRTAERPRYTYWGIQTNGRGTSRRRPCRP